MANFEVALEKTLKFEGVWSNDKYDSGGKTRYGITEQVARANGYTGPMEALPMETAHRIYKTQYWDTLRLDTVNSQAIAAIVWDMGVNCGVGSAGKALQEALNIANKQGTRWANINIDGVLGPVTISTLNQATKDSKLERIIFKIIIALRMKRYIEIVERNETQEDFIIGWLNRVLSFVEDIP